MSNYGIQAEDVDGSTIIVSDTFTEFALDFRTVVGVDPSIVSLSAFTLFTTTTQTIPDNQFANYFHQYRTKSTQPETATTNYTVVSASAGDASAASPYTLAVPISPALPIGSVCVSNSAVVAQFRGVGNNGTVDYYVYEFDKVMTGISNGTTAFRKLVSRDSAPLQVNPATNIDYWVRPQSPSYTGTFALQLLRFTTGTNLGTPAGYQTTTGTNIPIANRYPPVQSAGKPFGTRVQVIDYTGGNNTFEICATVTAPRWGTFDPSTVTEFYDYETAGATGDYGLESFGLESFSAFAGGKYSELEFTSRARTLRSLLTKTVPEPNTGSVINTTLGTLPVSSTKRWCRMRDTLGWKRAGNNLEYRHFYNWQSNNNISIRWQSIGASSGAGDIFTTSDIPAQSFFAVGEFGDGI